MKKILCVLLALAMVCGLGMPVFAAVQKRNITVEVSCACGNTATCKNYVTWGATQITGSTALTKRKMALMSGTPVTVTAVEDPACGMKFLYWEQSGKLKGCIPDKTAKTITLDYSKTTGNDTLKAVFGKAEEATPECTVRFNSKVPYCAAQSATFDEGTEIQLSKVYKGGFYKDIAQLKDDEMFVGYRLAGWGKDSTNPKVDYALDATVKLEDDLELYAVWEAYELDYWTFTLTEHGTLSYHKTLNMIWRDEATVLSYPESFKAYLNGGDKILAATYVPVEAIPNENYEFTGWKLPDGTLFYDKAKLVIGDFRDEFDYSKRDLTLIATFEGCPWTLMFDPAGGTVDPTEKTVRYDAEIGELPVPTRAGYTFLGWFTAQDGGTEVTAKTVYEKTEDSTIIAQWEANDYTLTLDANGGKVEPDTLTVTFDTEIGELPVPTRFGYAFGGWYDKRGNKVLDTTVYQTAGDSRLVARWYDIDTVILDGNGESHPGEVNPATGAPVLFGMLTLVFGGFVLLKKHK